MSDRFVVREHWSSLDGRGPFELLENVTGREVRLVTVRSKDDAVAVAGRLNELWRLAGYGGGGEAQVSDDVPGLRPDAQG